MAASNIVRLIVMLSVATALSGCGNPIRQKVERGIEEALPHLVGEAASYQVQTSGSTFRMLKGKFSTIRVVGKDVKLSNGVKLADLVVHANDVVFDTQTRMIRRAGRTEYSATVSEEQLNRYLVKMHPSIPGLNVELLNGRLRVQVKPELAGVAAQIDAEGDLKIKNGRYLLFDLKDVKVVGLSTPGFAREYIESRINPVFDVASFGYDAKVSSVRIRRGALQVSGTLDLAKELNVEP